MGLPVLSSVPVIGPLFKSRSTRKEQTELLVVVTPRLVRPIDGIAPPMPLPLIPTDPKKFFQPVDPRKYGTGQPGTSETEQAAPKKPGGVQ